MLQKVDYISPIYLVIIILNKIKRLISIHIDYIYHLSGKKKLLLGIGVCKLWADLLLREFRYGTLGKSFKSTD